MTEWMKNRQKRLRFRDLYEAYPWVFVHFDLRVDGTMVPARAGADKQYLCFQIGKGLPVPIPDLAWNEEAITGTLRFAGQFRGVRVPWASVRAMSVDSPLRVYRWLEPGETEAAILGVTKPGSGQHRVLLRNRVHARGWRVIEGGVRK